MRWIMAENSRNNAIKTPGRGRGRPFEKGNAGRLKGVRNRATIAAEVLLDGEAEALVRKAVELALGGDVVALKLCLDRLLPPRRERSLALNLPSVRNPGDHAEMSAAIIDAVSKGEVTIGEAVELARLVAVHMAALESSERYENMAPTFPGLNSLLRSRGRSEVDE
jgi:hypothetical protein